MIYNYETKTFKQNAKRLAVFLSKDETEYADTVCSIYTMNGKTSNDISHHRDISNGYCSFFTVNACSKQRKNYLLLTNAERTLSISENWSCSLRVSFRLDYLESMRYNSSTMPNIILIEHETIYELNGKNLLYKYLTFKNNEEKSDVIYKTFEGQQSLVDIVFVKVDDSDIINKESFDNLDTIEKDFSSLKTKYLYTILNKLKMAYIAQLSIQKAKYYSISQFNKNGTFLAKKDGILGIKRLAELLNVSERTIISRLKDKKAIEYNGKLYVVSLTGEEVKDVTLADKIEVDTKDFTKEDYIEKVHFLKSEGVSKLKISEILSISRRQVENYIKGWQDYISSKEDEIGKKCGL